MPYSRVVIREFGGPEVLELVTEESLPEPRGSEVRVRVIATSAAFTDVMIRKGMYPDVRERPPFSPGYDMVGAVDRLGPDARRFDVGTRVADLTTIGAYAEYVCRDENDLTPVPEGVDSVDAVSAILSAVTPCQMLHRVARVEKGQRILVHGAAGAVGTMMLQLARLAGVTAFGTDVADKHYLIRELGGIPIDSAAEGLQERMLELTAPGVDVVFDPLGGESLDRSLHVLGPGGMLVAYGFQDAVLGRGGNIPFDFVRLKLWDLLPNGHATAFYSIGAMRRRHPEWFNEDLADMLRLLADERLVPIISRTLPLGDARRAHEMLEAGEVEGKIVLRVSPG